MLKAYTVFARNHFFGNNSGKPEPIDTKFYRQTYGRMHAPVSFWRPQPNGRTMAPKKIAFCELFVSKTMHRFTHFQADDFNEIYIQSINGCGQKTIGTKFQNVSEKESFTPKTSFLGFFGVYLRCARSSLGL